ncbi:MAG TPA: hypothetical protein VNO21_27635 [Polyangiaceae bacterium]|nr:hypothetical protein [Polyangiaceae bacterium]
MLEVFSKLFFFPVLSWDLKYARRTLVFAGLAFAVAFALTAATDEGDVAWWVRLGRTWPVIPVCAAVGAWGALATARARRERLALETLGRSPQKNAAGAIAAGVLVSLVGGAVLAACPSIDLQGYFPTLARGGDFVFDGAGFVDRERGIRVGQDGTSQSVPVTHDGVGTDGAQAPLASTAGARGVAASVTAIAGSALTLLAACVQNATARARTRLAAAVLLAVLGTIVLFHGAAALHATVRPTGTLLLLAATLPAWSLLAYALARYRSDPGESGRG